jgi:hypothetical protein
MTSKYNKKSGFSAVRFKSSIAERSENLNIKVEIS